MKKTAQIVLGLIFLIAPMYADVRTEIRSFLPSDVELKEKYLLFDKYFLHQDLQSFLCKKARKAHEEGGEKLTYWTKIIHFLDGFSYEIDDDEENDFLAGRKLNLSRARDLLVGKECKLNLSITRLDYAVDGFKGYAQKIADLFASSLTNNFNTMSIRYTAWLDSPIIYLVFDEANQHKLVGCMWAFAHLIPIEQEEEVKQVKVWDLKYLCCLPELVDMGIEQKMFNALKRDPQIEYVSIEVYNDNNYVKEFCLGQGYHVANAPKAGINRYSEGYSTWFYGLHHDGQVLPYRPIGK